MMNPETPQTTKRRLGAWKKPTACPGCDRPDTIGVALLPSVQEIQGAEVRCEVDKWHCSACGAEWMSPDQVTAAVGAAVRTYQQQNGLLTGDECREARKDIGWTQDDLATASDVGIATIKRLESGVHVIGKLQSNALKGALAEAGRCLVPDYRIEFEVPCAASIPALDDLAALVGEILYDEVSYDDDPNPASPVDSNVPALAA